MSPGLAHQDAQPMGVAVAVCGVTAVEVRGDEYKSLDLYRDAESIPPAAICGELSGEKLVADVSGFPHIRGSGLSWPLSSGVSQKTGSARFPAALAWSLCDHKNRDSWYWSTPHGRRQSVSPVDVIAQIGETVLSRFGIIHDDRLATFVVPNTFDTEAQDDLLRALTARGIRPHLLWRPIAAALAWVGEHASTILGAGSKTYTPDVPLGVLWIVHLGLDAFELTQLELIPWQHGGKQFVLPARRLPSLPSLYGLGLEWAEDVAEQSLNAEDNAIGAAWNLLWTTTWLERVVAQLDMRSKKSIAPDSSLMLHRTGAIDRGVSAARTLLEGLADRTTPKISSSSITQLRRSFAPLDGPFAQEKLGRSGASMPLGGWIAELRQLVRTDLPVLGMVGTGAFATLPCDGRTLCEHVVRIVGGIERIPGVIVDCGSEILSRGAAIYANRRQASLPTYLDVLPKLELLIVRSGEPVFEDIIRLDTAYVLGGQERGFEPADLGLRVRREERSLTLSVWREGHEFVRDVSVDFSQLIPRDTPVQLQVRMTPGQGNPRIEVKPEVVHAFGGRRVYLDWARARDTGRSREEELSNVPRTNPPLEPRLSSLDAWRGSWWQSAGAKSELASFLSDLPRLTEKSLADRMDGILKVLRDKDPEAARQRIPEHATVASSEGRVHPLATDSELFERFVNTLDSLLVSSKHGDCKVKIVRALGYCSADTPHLRELLTSIIRHPSRIDGHHLVGLGNCLRDPQEIAVLAEAMVTNLRIDRPRAPNDWMRAMCRVLQYRDKAADEITSPTCTAIAQCCLRYLQQQISEGGAKFLYRHASLCIVYLLRRRRRDDGYLEPGGPLAKQIKSVFAEAIAKFQTGRLEAIEGFVNLPHVTRMMIDYIDRKGKGRLIGFSAGE